MNCFFVSDLHGKKNRYDALFEQIRKRIPEYLLIGGDILPLKEPEAFINSYFLPEISRLKSDMKEKFPVILAIPGNDDPAAFDIFFREADKEGLLHFIPERTIKADSYTVTGYPFVPPTPFMLKDREKYDVSRYVDPGCLAPDEGNRTVEPDYDTEFSNIATDLKKLSAGIDASKSIFLFHSPPYKSPLDRAALDGKTFDHVPLDVHVGSIAIQRFIDDFQPMLTLHGHIHESFRITGEWQVINGKTISMSAASDIKGLTIITFNTNNLSTAKREEIDC